MIKILWTNSVFHSKVLLPYFCWYLTTKTSTWDNILKLWASPISSTHIVSLIIDEDNSYWIQSLVFNSNIPNQHLLLSWTLSIYLKLWLCNRQIAQHMGWSQGYSTSLYYQAQSLHTLCTSQVNFVDFWCQSWK